MQWTKMMLKSGLTIYYMQLTQQHAKLKKVFLSLHFAQYKFACSCSEMDALYIYYTYLTFNQQF